MARIKKNTIKEEITNNLIEYLYVIKIEYQGSTFGYKIGEYDGGARPESLVKKYNFEATPTILISDIELPHNYERRLKDTDVHKKITEDKILKNVDSAVVRKILNESDGKEEVFRLYDGQEKEFNTDAKIVNYIKSVVEELKADENNYSAKVEHRKDVILSYKQDGEDEQEQKPLVKDIKPKHLVEGQYIDLFIKKSQVMEEILKKILLIGQFEKDFITFLAGYNDVTILFDSKHEDYYHIKSKEIRNKLHYFYTTETLIEEASKIDKETNMCKEFDYIIANPPYSLGNEITTTIIKNVRFKKYINLMPVSDYKKKETELYKYISDIEHVEDFFEDADIGENLTIATLNRTAVGGFNSYNELEIYNCDPKLTKFYIGNSNRKNNINYCYIYKISKDKEEVRNALNQINSDTDFFINSRAAGDGVHIKAIALDRIWNLGEKVSNAIFGISKWTGGGWGTQGGYIFFKTKEEKDNFTEFWYRDGNKGLMHKLLKGLNKNDGPIELAIPRVDWTRKWTDEEILKEYGYTEEEIKEIL